MANDLPQENPDHIPGFDSMDDLILTILSCISYSKYILSDIVDTIFLTDLVSPWRRVWVGLALVNDTKVGKVYTLFETFLTEIPDFPTQAFRLALLLKALRENSFPAHLPELDRCITALLYLARHKRNVVGSYEREKFKAAYPHSIWYMRKILSLGDL